jgi:arginase
VTESAIHTLKPAGSALAIDLIGASMGLGGPDAGAAGAPSVLQRLGLAGVLRASGHSASWRAPLLPRLVFGESRLDAVREFNHRLANRVAASVLARRFPLVFGGDHSIAAGTWAGVASALQRSGRARPGLLWIDAHMDSHTTQTTPSGNPHGMPLAELLGAGAAPASLSPRHVALIGVRSYEPAEADLLAQLGVRVYFADEIARRGLAIVMNEALARVAQAGAYGVTVDIDAIDPLDAPATSTREFGGLGAGALIRALGQLQRVPGLVAGEIVEYNPFLDRDGATAKLVENLAAALLEGALR